MKLKFGFYDLFEGSDIDKKVLSLIFIIFIGLFGIGISTLIYFENKAGECNYSKQKFFKFEYEGEIARTFRSSNHGHTTTVFEDGTSKSLIFDYRIWEKLRQGDILIKHKNELNFIIIRGSDTTFHKENIPDCEQFKK